MPPNSTLQFADQTTAITQVLQAAVNTRLDAEFATMCAEIVGLAHPRAGLSVAQSPDVDVSAGN